MGPPDREYSVERLRAWLGCRSELLLLLPHGVAGDMKPQCPAVDEVDVDLGVVALNKRVAGIARVIDARPYPRLSSRR